MNMLQSCPYHRKIHTKNCYNLVSIHPLIVRKSLLSIYVSRERKERKKRKQSTTKRSLVKKNVVLEASISVVVITVLLF